MSSPSAVETWKTRPIRRRISLGSDVTSIPSMNADPLDGVRRVVRSETVVVFPAPFGPRNPKISPARTWKFTPSTASFTGSPRRLGGYAIRRSFAWMTGVPGAVGEAFAIGVVVGMDGEATPGEGMA